MIDRTIRLAQRTQASEAPTALRSILPQPRTTRFEQFLIWITILLIPLQEYFPAVAGMSVVFLSYCVLAAYIIMNRQLALRESWCHPVFIAAYVFIVVSALLEYSSPLTRYEQIIRFAQMIGGALCMAALCRDRSALAAGLYGLITSALLVSVVLYSTSYGTLQEMSAEDFQQASQVRSQTFGDNSPLAANLNSLAFMCAQGAIVAFALSVTTRLKHLRNLFLGICGFCLIASLLPMSRGIAVGSFVSFAVILYAHRIRQGKMLIVASLLGLILYALVPDAVWSRMTFTTESRAGKTELRTKLYTTAFDHLPEYIVAGVGAGNYFNQWGAKKGFGKEVKGVWHVYGVHNSLLQITIFWGVLGLFMFLLIIWCVYRTIPLRCGRDGLSLALLGILVALGLALLQGHGFYSKSYAVDLGMLVGARQWIWPTGVVSAVEVKQGPLRDRM
jgi:hypothetical protein